MSLATRGTSKLAGDATVGRSIAPSYGDVPPGGRDLRGLNADAAIFHLAAVALQADGAGVGKLEGRFQDFDGTIVYDPKNPAASRVEFEIRVASIDTKIGTRDRMLLSEDFFHAERYPTMSFRSTNVAPTGRDTFQVTGNLIIRGVTRKITAPVRLLGFSHYNDGSERVNIAGFETSFTLDRTAFGVNGTRWSAGEMILGNEVNITLIVSVENRVPASAARAR